MINSIQAFAIPVGETLLPTSICDQFKNADTDIGQVLNDSAPNFQFLDDYVEAKNTIIKLFEDFAEGIYGYRQDWRITSSWLTCNSEGDMMYRHNHTNCIYSGVLYPFTYAVEHPPLMLENPIPDLSSFGLRVAKPGPLFADYVGKHPIPTGHMIFFPSYLYHYHPSFQKTDIARKSIAFNFFPNEDFGINDSLFCTHENRNKKI